LEMGEIAQLIEAVLGDLPCALRSLVGPSRAAEPTEEDQQDRGGRCNKTSLSKDELLHPISSGFRKRGDRLMSLEPVDVLQHFADARIAQSGSLRRRTVSNRDEFGF